MAWIIRFILNVLIILGMSQVLGNGVPVSGFVNAAVFILVLTLLNWTLIPVLKFMTLPLNFLTLGLIGILINGLAVVLAGVVLNVRIEFLAGLIVSFVLGLVNGLAENSINRI